MSLHIGFMFICLVVSTSVRASPPSPTKSERILNPVVLLTGGDTPISKSSVEVFNPSQNGYCTKDLEDLSKARMGHTMNFFKGGVIMCGGCFNYQYPTKDCQSLDENQRFVPHSQLNEIRTWHEAAVVSDTLLIVGGHWSKSMESWNGSQWVMQKMNSEKSEACMAAISEDTILIAGGDDDNYVNITNKMYKYENGVWERMEDFPGPPRDELSCAFIQTPEGDSFLIAGGEDVMEAFDTSYLYNIEKRQWEEVGKLASPRSHGKIVVINGRIIILGGQHYDRRETLVDVEEYNVEKKTWTTIQRKIKRGRANFAAAVIPGALVGC